VPPFHQVNLFEGVIDFFVLFFAADTSQPGIEIKVFFYSERWPKNVELRTDSHLQMNQIDLITDTVAADMSVPRSWPKNTSNHRKKCGFACSIWSQQSKNTPVFNHQIKSVNCQLAIIIFLGQFFNDKWMVRVVINFINIFLLLLDCGITVGYLIILFFTLYVFMMLVRSFPDTVHHEVEREEKWFGNSELLGNDLEKIHA